MMRIADSHLTPAAKDSSLPNLYINAFE